VSLDTLIQFSKEYEVKDGKLILYKEIFPGRSIIVFQGDLLNWELAEKKTPESKEVASESLYEYDLGEYGDANFDPQKYKFKSLEGSVDATPFSEKLHEAQWYRAKIVAAKALLGIYNSTPASAG